MRVLAFNEQGDGPPSEELTGTPKAGPAVQPDRGGPERGRTGFEQTSSRAATVPSSRVWVWARPGIWTPVRK